MGDIGEPLRRRHYEPMPETIPVPEIVPATQPAPDHEEVPA